MLADKTITKHVSIIHAFSLMSSLQRKIVNVLLFEAVNRSSCFPNNHESVALECRMPFSALYKAINFKSNNTQYLKEAIDGLASLKIEWNLLKDKTPSDISFLNLRILHGSPTFFKDGTFNFSFHKVMLPLVDKPSIYGTIDINLQSQFESKYSHALYENSTRFVNLQKNKIIQLDTFRRLLGVENNKYDGMRELTRNVFTPAIEEVNDRAGFVVNLEKVTVGRKITGFLLSVNDKNKHAKRIVSSEDNKNLNIINELKNSFGVIKENIIYSILRNYSAEYIFEKIAYTKRFARKESSNLFPIAYLLSALKNDYKLKTNFENKTVPISTPQVKPDLWEIKLQSLIADLNHWKDRLAFFMQMNNASQIEIVKKVILSCEEKIAKHHIENKQEREANNEVFSL